MKLRKNNSDKGAGSGCMARLVRLLDFRTIIQLCYLLIGFCVLMIGLNTWLLVDKDNAVPAIEKTAKKII
jgi:hypothetical protein